MVTGSRIAWWERSISLWDRALKVVPSALLELARMSSDVEIGWNRSGMKYDVSRLHLANNVPRRKRGSLGKSAKVGSTPG